MVLSPEVQCCWCQRLANNMPEDCLASRLILNLLWSVNGNSIFHEPSAIFFFRQHPIFNPLEITLVPPSKQAQNFSVSLTMASILPQASVTAVTLLSPSPAPGASACTSLYHSEETTGLETEGHQKRKSLSLSWFLFLTGWQPGILTSLTRLPQKNCPPLSQKLNKLDCYNDQ